MKAKYIALLVLVAFAACKAKNKQETLQVEVTPQDTVQVVKVPEPEPVVEIIDEGVNPDDKFFLIIDSYTVEDFANSWKKTYADRGFKADLVMKNEDGYFRLALKSFNDLELAEKALAEMQKEAEFSKMWILIR